MNREKKGVIILATIVMSVFVSVLIFNQNVSPTGFAVFSDGSGGQTTLTLQDASSDNLGDAYVGSGGDANKNFGSLSILKTGSVASSYLSFNISAIPSGQLVDGAELCAYVTTKKIQKINLHHVYENFDESTITWDNQPCGIAFDDSSACNLTSESFFQVDGSSQNTWKCSDVKNMVGKAYDDVTLFNVVLYTTDLDINTYYSKENAELSLRPYLNITYHTANLAPTISLVSPQEGTTYGYNESLALNYNVQDSDNNIDSCWYKIDSGSSVVLPGCANNTFDIGEGVHGLTIYVNDSYGLEASDSVSFSVAVGAPTITLASPINSYLNNGAVSFVYTATDVDLETCALYGNFGGVFGLNQTDSSVVSGIEDSFSLDLLDGKYLWNVWCNDSVGNSAFNGNKTFYVDSVNPSVSITQPSGDKTSRSNIALDFSVSDSSPTTCRYNVYRGGSIEIANTTIGCSASSSFNVTVDADFTLNLFVNDSAGNANSASSSFSVSTSVVVPPVPSGGSGGGSSGGGGFSGGIASAVSMKIEIVKGVGDVIVYPGDERTLEVGVQNKGLKSVNKCKLIGDAESSDMKNIGPGEIVEFVFTLSVPKNGSEYAPNIELVCIEGSINIPLNIVLINPGINIEVTKMELQESGLVVDYVLETSQGVELVFSIFDLRNKLISEKIVTLSESGRIVLDLSGAEEGMYKLVIMKSSENLPLVEESFVYGGKSLLTGFALFDVLKDNGSMIGIGVIGLVFVVIAGLLVFRIIRLRRKAKNSGEK